MSITTGVSKFCISINSAITSTTGQKVYHLIYQLIYVHQVKPKTEYNLRIKVHNEMLVHLINLFVGWEMKVLERLWLDRMGYK
jgi:hypothetical protein